MTLAAAFALGCIVGALIACWRGMRGVDAMLARHRKEARRQYQRGFEDGKRMRAHLDKDGA